MLVNTRQSPQAPPITFSQSLTYSKAHSCLAIAVTLVSIALLIFLLRVYARIKLHRFFAISDGIMVLSIVRILGLDFQNIMYSKN